MLKKFNPLIKFNSINSDFLRYINCPICDSNKYNIVKKINGWSIVRCESCGFRYSNPRVKNDVINEYYSSRENNYDIVKTDINISEKKSLFFKSIIEILINKFNRDDDLVNFIEIGSGEGSFIRLLSDKVKWNIKGYEPCLNVKFDNVVSGDFMKLNIIENSVDIVFSASVLEHIYDINNLFIKVNKILKPGGLFISSGMPNYNSLANFTKIKNFKSDCPPTHVNYFDKKSLYFLLKKSGFNDIKIKTYGLSNKIAKNDNNVVLSNKNKKTSIDLFADFYLKNIFLLPHFTLGDKLLLMAKK